MKLAALKILHPSVREEMLIRGAMSFCDSLEKRTDLVSSVARTHLKIYQTINSTAEEGKKRVEGDIRAFYKMDLDFFQRGMEKSQTQVVF